MDQDREVRKEPIQVIREIESQLDRLLQKRVGDIERDLAARISQEKEAAKRRKEELERDFDREREALAEYRNAVREAEEERANLLLEARKHFDKVVVLQAEIESLAKSTVDEIKLVTGIQERIEALRDRTSERAAFLKNDLRERFGIVTDVLEEEEKAPEIDLDQELGKLRKIKELLAIESAAVGLRGPARESGEAEGFVPLDVPEPPAGFRIPEIQELVAEAPEAPEPQASPAPASAGLGETAVAAGTAAAPAPAEEEEPEEAVTAALEACRRAEPANGSGEILYFQKDSKILVDGESLFVAIDKAVDEANRLSAKLGQTESPKDQFFIKQELINWQEGLRALFLRVIKMTEKKIWELPACTSAVVNAQSLRAILERLSMENWSNAEEFASFVAAAAEMRKAFLERTTPRGAYLRALRKELQPR
jgi:hypothetical protein